MSCLGIIYNTELTDFICGHDFAEAKRIYQNSNITYTEVVENIDHFIRSFFGTLMVITPPLATLSIANACHLLFKKKGPKQILTIIGASCMFPIFFYGYFFHEKITDLICEPEISSTTHSIWKNVNDFIWTSCSLALPLLTVLTLIIYLCINYECSFKMSHREHHHHEKPENGENAQCFILISNHKVVQKNYFRTSYYFNSVLEGVNDV